MKQFLTSIGFFVTGIGFLSTIGLTQGIRADVGSGTFHLYQFLFIIPFVIAGYAHKKRNQLISTIALAICTLISVVLGAIVLFYDHKPYTELSDLYINKGSLYMGYMVMIVGLMINRHILKIEAYDD